MKPGAISILSFHSLIIPFVVSAFFVAFTASAQNLWTEIPLPVTNIRLSDISFVDSLHGCLSGSDGLFLYTSDGGSNWSVDTIPAYSTKRGLVSSNVAWCFGFGGINPGQATFYRSSDRGRTWQRKYYPDTLIVLGADFISETVAHLVTPSHSWTTTDGGDSWHERGQLLGSSQYLHEHSVEFFDDTTGYVSGSYQLVGGDRFPQKTTDGGYSWSHGYVGIMGSGGSTINNSSGPIRFAGGRSCAFFFDWVDEISTQHFGGLVLSWNRLQDTILIGPQMGFFSPNGYSIGYALNRQNIWLLRGVSDGRILRTTNSGATWAFDTLPVSISDLLLDLDGHRFALGRGRLFRWNGPPLDIKLSKENPSRFALQQNFPNPFNPSTTISYELPLPSFVTLSVFNVLGQEIAQLVNEQQQAGLRQAIFTSDGLASGVYIYRLRVGDFFEARKMLLLR